MEHGGPAGAAGLGVVAPHHTQAAEEHPQVPVHLQPTVRTAVRGTNKTAWFSGMASVTLILYGCPTIMLYLHNNPAGQTDNITTPTCPPADWSSGNCTDRDWSAVQGL